MSTSLTHSPGPWQPCGANSGRCVCGRVWSRPADVPVATMLYGPDEDEPLPSFEIACGNAMLIAQSPNAPHVCSDPKCPGDVNRRKLDSWTDLYETLSAFRYHHASVETLLDNLKELMQ